MRTGTIIKARIKDETIDIITVSAKPPTNSMLEPSPVTIGKKANTVVPVAAANGVVNWVSVWLIDSFTDKFFDLRYL